MQKLKVFYHNNITWIYTIQYILFSILLLIFVALVDLKILPLSIYIPDAIKINVKFSQGILTSLSAAFLTITTFTFSTILTVLGTYSSNFTPRVVENFINMKITLKVIGIFIGGFFYCIGSLIFTREAFHEDLVISGFIAILYSIICLAYFIVFVQKVLKKFQGVNIILDLADIAGRVVDDEVKSRKEIAGFFKKEELEGIDILAKNSGYLSLIDLDALINRFKEHKGYLKIGAKLGEYVPENSKLATLYLEANGSEIEAEDITSFFILQDNKLETLDYRYNITKLLEIALRAISPGINDPNTAIHCINKLGVLLSSFAKINNYHIEKYGNKDFRIFYRSYSFKEDLETFYLPLIHYGKDDLQVTLAILKSLTSLYYQATASNKDIICYIVGHLEEKVETSLTTALERSLLQPYFEKIHKQL